jgi:hypothetical protein
VERHAHASGKIGLECMIAEGGEFELSPPSFPTCRGGART